MAKVSSHGGHNANVNGANYGGRYEHKMDRDCNTTFINKLRALGHDVKNDTDDNGTTAAGIVNNQIRNINSRYNDVGFSWHLNASDTTGHGVEVLCYSEKELPMAHKISAEIAKRTGWRNRGGKIRPDLGVIRSTACPVFLIEAGFIDNDSDMAKWNVDKITSAVIFAYFGQETGSNGGGSTGGSNNAGGGSVSTGSVLVTGGLSWDYANELCKFVVENTKADAKINIAKNGIINLEVPNLSDAQLQELEWWVWGKGWAYSINGTWKEGKK